MTLTTFQLVIFVFFTINSTLAVHFFQEFAREKKPKLSINPHILVMFLSSIIWSIGMGMMSIQTDDSKAYFWRTFGIFGTFMFMISVQIILCKLSGLNHKLQLFFDAVSITGIIVFILYSQPGQTIFVHNNIGTTFYFKPGRINDLYSLYFMIVSLNLLIVTVYIALKHKRKQIRIAGRNFVIIELCIFVGAILDMIMPSSGTPALPGSAITHFWGVFILWFTIHNLYKSEIIISNMSEYIYYSLSIPVMVFDSNYKLQIINDSSKSFYNFEEFVPSVKNYKISDLYNLSDDIFDFDGSNSTIQSTCLVNNTSCELTISKIYDRFKDLIGYIVIIGDLTEHELVIAKLEQAKLAADSANMSKSLFLANMSHEIRTPMNAILGFSEIALSEDIDTASKEYFTDIKHAGETLLSIINQILDISKIELGSQTLNCGNYSSDRIFKDIELIINMQAHKKNLDFTMEIDKSFPSELYGDKDKIRQILINLLNNSVKYTEKGHVSLTVKLLDKENEDIRIQYIISDTGIGIGKDDLPKIFDKFHRVDSSYSSTTEGTGLGLPITKGLVEMMQGSIYVQSEVGKGSQFIVELTQRMVNETPISQNQKDELSSSISNNLSTTKKFLAVDDNKVNLKVISRLLDKYSVSHDVAQSGEEAINMCKENSYDIILLDQMMPVMDGIETLKNLRTIPEYSKDKVKIIALTANVGVGVEDSLLAQGFDAYISKPINIVNFEKLLKSLA